MNRVNEIMLNNNEEINLCSNSIFPLINREYISKPYNNEISTELKNISNDNIFIPKLKNVFQDESLSLNESDEEDNDNSIYFIKSSNNFETISHSTENTTNNIEKHEKYIKEKKEDSKKKIINFKTTLRKKRGKKPKTFLSKKCHGSEDFDNIQRKIHVHYISFLISLANDKLNQFFGKKNKYHFKDVKYELKRVVNHKNVEFLKKSKYSDIIQMKISPKNKKFSEETNKNIYLEIIQLSSELKNFFDKNYLYIFQKYYFGLKSNQKEINYEGKFLALSSKTKGLNHLLEKNSFSRKFNDIIQNVYFSDTNYLSDKKFVTTNLFI